MKTPLPAAALLAWHLAGGSVYAQSPADLAQALQRKYSTVKDFSADFTHTYRGGALKKALTEKGRLLIKKPGKMRWEYTAPEQKLFVSDGVKIYSYIPRTSRSSSGPCRRTTRRPRLCSWRGKGT